jgi:hypothetical protein
MRVRVEENGASITCDLTECFPGPENHDDLQEALASLIATGEYVGGGGAASAYVITVADPAILFETRLSDLGVVRVERWPEGLCLWVGGEIRWKSWEESQDPVQARDKLITEFAAWCQGQGLPRLSADELLCEIDEDATPEQRAYLNDFIARWTAAEFRDLSGRA